VYPSWHISVSSGGRKGKKKKRKGEKKRKEILLPFVIEVCPKGDPPRVGFPAINI